MKIKDFLKSKRNWTIIALGIAETAAALFPGRVPDLSEILRAIFGAS